MALYNLYPNRTPNPLGGREAKGFDWWLMVTAQAAREAFEDARVNRPLGDNLRYIATGADTHYADVLKEWKDVKAGRSRFARDDLSRDHFETRLISRVMRVHGAAEYARQCGYGPDDTTAGGRPMVDVAAEYLRACIILAQYVGVSEVIVAECGDDQGKLSALRAGSEG